MARALAELDRVDQLHGLGAPPPPQRRRRRRLRLDVTVGVAVGVVALFLLLNALRSLPGSVLAEPAPSAPPAAVANPPLPYDGLPHRVLPPVTTTATGAHAFLMTRPDGTPVGFDPCRPIHYVVNPLGMPGGGLQLVRDAVAEIGAATGLAFSDDGVTAEPLGEFRESIQPQRYGEGWAPVLVGWADESELALVGGEITGVGSAVPIAPRGPGSEHYVTGRIVLDRTWFAKALADPKRASAARSVVLHELGHLVGLDHVDDRGQLMYGGGSAPAIGPGDRQGLAAVGAGGCRG